MNQAAKRQQELKDPQLRDELAAACAVLKKKTLDHAVDGFESLRPPSGTRSCQS
jgi:hypothetical protein